MYSILNNKITKDLTSIVSQYLLTSNIKNKEKFSEIISLNYPHNSIFLNQCYFLQLKRTFPQTLEEDLNSFSLRTFKFNIKNLMDIRYQHYVFVENKYINSYISTFVDYIYFIDRSHVIKS